MSIKIWKNYKYYFTLNKKKIQVNRNKYKINLGVKSL